MPTAVFAAQEEYNELLRYAVVVPSYPHLPSLTATASTVGGPSLSVSHPAQVTSTQTRTVGGVHIVASTEASRVGVQTDEADVITVCPSVHPTTYVGPSVSSRSSVPGLLGFIVTFFLQDKNAVFRVAGKPGCRDIRRWSGKSHGICLVRENPSSYFKAYFVGWSLVCLLYLDAEKLPGKVGTLCSVCGVATLFSVFVLFTLFIKIVKLSNLQ